MSDIALIQQFLDYLRLERHFSPYTARCYGADLRQFAQFISGELEASPVAADAAPAPQGDNGKAEPDATHPGVSRQIVEADPLLIRRFLAHLDEFAYSAATMARKIATLRSFYKFLVRQGVVTTNPSRYFCWSVRVCCRTLRSCVSVCWPASSMAGTTT